MNILGINDHHNSSASLLIDGKLICAMQEERFTRKKNFWGTPKHSVLAALDFARLAFKDIDLIVFAGHRHSGHVCFSREEHMRAIRELVQMDLIDTLRARTEVSLRKVLWGRLRNVAYQNFPGYMHQREMAKMRHNRLDLFYGYFPQAKEIPFQFLDHHVCHFATAYFGAGQPNGERLVFTNDGQGDFRCASVTRVALDGRRQVLSSVSDKDSIAQIWAFITFLTGFVPLEHEYKLMGMAPYASLARSEKVAEAFEDLFVWEDGRFRLKNRKIIHSMSVGPLLEDIRRICRFQRFDDICGGLQKFTDRALARWIRYWIEQTGIRDLCLSGGTFMNVKANLEIMEMPEVRSLFVFPSCGDETNAIGACYEAYFQKTGRFPEALRDFYLGKDWSKDEIESAIAKLDGRLMSVRRCDKIEDTVARLLAGNEVVARFKGREEFGARALGSRSILANPSQWSVVAQINDMIKQRDFWMPFACSILAEDQHRYIRSQGKNCGQYMIMAFRGGGEVGAILAGCHPRDKTVRPQIVHREKSPDYHALISRFKELTGIGAVLNTSFNLHGYPLVHSPEDALDVFLHSGLKNLAIGDYLVTKNTIGTWPVLQKTSQEAEPKTISVG